MYLWYERCEKYVSQAGVGRDSILQLALFQNTKKGELLPFNKNILVTKTKLKTILEPRRSEETKKYPVG